MTQFPDQVRPILVSIISHGHGACVTSLLEDLASPGNADWVRVILTLNVADEDVPLPEHLPYQLHIQTNPFPKGFAANHNAAFQLGMQEQATQLFCVLNPDIRMPPGTMLNMVRQFHASPALALAAPSVRAPDGSQEDSARILPTPFSTLVRGVGRLLGYASDAPISVRDWDWLAGMFMLFDSHAFREVGGFDEGFHLYYEDVDICCRIRLAGGTLRYCPEVTVVHDARRDSHHRFGYFLRHLRSVTRFFLSTTYRRCRRLPRLHVEDTESD